MELEIGFREQQGIKRIIVKKNNNVRPKLRLRRPRFILRGKTSLIC